MNGRERQDRENPPAHEHVKKKTNMDTVKDMDPDTVVGTSVCVQPECEDKWANAGAL